MPTQRLEAWQSPSSSQDPIPLLSSAVKPLRCHQRKNAGLIRSLSFKTVPAVHEKQPKATFGPQHQGLSQPLTVTLLEPLPSVLPPSQAVSSPFPLPPPLLPSSIPPAPELSSAATSSDSPASPGSERPWPHTALLCPRPAGLGRAEGAGPSAWPRLRMLTGQMDECEDKQTHHTGGGPDSPSESLHFTTKCGGDNTREGGGGSARRQ